ALLFSLLSMRSVSGQTAEGPLKLYKDENGRLKQQIAALKTENEELKRAQQAENSNSSQMKSNLDNLQTAITEREGRLSELNGELSTAHEMVAQWKHLALFLLWSIPIFFSILLAYFQRTILRQQLLKLMEQLLKFIERCIAEISPNSSSN